MRIRITALTLVGLFAVLSADAQFTQLKSYGVGAGLDQFVEADLNHYSKPDIVGSGYTNGTFNVTALLGDGKGGFSAPIVSAMTGINVNGAPPQAVADFNNDGFPDFAFVGTDPVTGAVAVGIMFGKGNGSFEAPEKIVLSKASAPGELAAGDFTGHGNIDLVYANGVNIMVLPGKGNGKFGSAVVSNISQYVRCIAVGDFNNDGKLDLTVGTSVMLGNGNGTFQSPITVPGGGCNVAVADLNHDGNLDLITGTSHKSIHVYLGNGSGNFSRFTAYDTGNDGSFAFPSFAVADFNGDGHPDIAVLNNSADDVTILLNKGNGSFDIGETFSGGSLDIAAGEFSGNKTEDLVVSSGVINVLVGKGDGTFRDTLAQNNAVAALQAIVADFNNDGKLDLLTFAPHAAVQLGNGNGTFQPTILLPTSCQVQDQNNNLQSAAVGDFNGDHKLDIAVIVANDQGVGVGVGVCLGKGDGTFEDAVFYDQGIDHGSVVTGDFNNDGKLDLAVSDQGGVSILLGNGNGTFQSGIPTALDATFPIFTVGDFNHDGNLDIAAITGTTISVLLGKGNGKFDTPITSTNTNAQFVTAGDLNKDGNLDLVTVETVGNNISVLLGKGDGTFQSPASYDGHGADQAALGDFNGDGILDIAFAEHANELDVLLGNGNGTFKPPVRFATFSASGWVEAGDFNGDGALDVVDLSYRPRVNKLVVFLNTK